MLETKEDEVLAVEDEKLYNNPLGFTRETAAMLAGLNCTNLSKFREKEINLDDLKFLTEEDLKILGVNDDFNKDSYQRLVFNLRKKYKENIPNVEEVLQILKNGSKQLQVIHLYIKYLNTKLSSSDIQDFIIDKNKNIKASNVLLEEIHNLYEELKELKETCDPKQKINSKVKYGLLKYSFLIGGTSIVLYFCVYRRYFK